MAIVSAYPLSWSRRPPRMMAVSAAGFAAFLNMYALQTLLPSLCRYFNAEQHQVSLTMSATTLAVALCSPFVGALVGRVSRRRLVGIALLGLTIFPILGALSPDLPTLIATRFFQGLFLPLLAASVMAYIGESWSRPKIGCAMANYVTWTVIGGFSGRFLAGLVAAHSNWRVALLVLSVLNAAAGALVYLSIPDSREQSQPFCWKELMAPLASSQLRVAFTAGFNVLFALVSMFTYVTFYLAAPPFSLQPDALGAIFCVYLVGVVATPIAGRALPRLGYRKLLRGAALTSGAGALCTLLPSLAAVLLGLALCAGATFVCQSATSGFVSQRSRQAVGLYLSCYYLGGCCGAFIPGYFWKTGGWPACVGLLLVVQAFNFRLAGKFRDAF